MIHVCRGLLEEDASRAESGFSFYLEEAWLVTLDVSYEKTDSSQAAAYNPIVRRLTTFSMKASTRQFVSMEGMRAC